MTTNETTGKRNRRTRAQMIAEYETKLATLKAKQEGTFDPATDDNYGVKRLRSAVRRRDTLLTTAGTLLNGRAATEKSPAVSDIDTKIANAEQRVANLKLSKVRAIEQMAALPADIDTLRALLVRAEAGETVEMPTNLYPIPENKTDAEIEAGAAVPSGD